MMSYSLASMEARTLLSFSTLHSLPRWSKMCFYLVRKCRISH